MIYFLHHVEAGRIKIGCTSVLHPRRRAIENQVGAKLVLVGVAAGQFPQERELHAKDFGQFEIAMRLLGKIIDTIYPRPEGEPDRAGVGMKLFVLLLLVGMGLSCYDQDS